MPEKSQKIDVKSCAKVDPPHVCDPQLPCDPFKEDEGECPLPYFCLDRIKNPAGPGEITRCRSGNFISVKSCAKVDPPHPCDPTAPQPPCSAKKNKKRPCSEPPLCLNRIKNPEKKKDLDSCDPDASK